MNELIKTITRDDGTVAVSGRELHEFLEVGKDFSTWFKDMTGYGFEEGKDFSPISGKTHNGGRPRIEYVMSLDMAKEVAMIQRTDRGKQARQYFIEIDKRYRNQQQVSPYQVPTTFVEAMQLATKEAEQIAKMAPKVDYFDKQMHNPGLMTTTIIAKAYGKSAKWLNAKLSEMGIIFKQGKAWVIKAKYADKGYTGYDNWADVDNQAVHPLLKWTQRGQKFIHDQLAAVGIQLIAEQMQLAEVSK